MIKENFSSKFTFMLQPSTSLGFKIWAHRLGVRPSDLLRKLIADFLSSPSAVSAELAPLQTESLPAPVKQLFDTSDRVELLRLKGELRRQGGLLKMLIVEQQAPREDFNPVIQEIAQLVRQIEAKLQEVA